MKTRSPWLAVLLLALAVPALAQDAPSTRADEARDARERKAATPAPPLAGKVERVLTWVETAPLIQHMAGKRDGLGVRVGGIPDGAGLAVGPSWRSTTMAGGAVRTSASAAVALSGDRQAVAALSLPQLTEGLTIGADVDATHLAQERFFGAGMDSAPTDRTAFLLDSRRVAARAAATPVAWLRFAGGAGVVTARAAGATTRIAPPIDTRFDAAAAPGLGETTRFTTLSVETTADSRDVPLNPRRGGRYHAAVSRYVDATHDRHSFTRVDAEVEQHLSAWRRQRVLTLRALASTSVPDRGHEVPFYLQSTLGGSRYLRGFVTDRFRDNSLVVLQAEYGWDLSPFAAAVLFYEAGAVAPRLRDISTSLLRRDYGIGLRFGSARTVAFRTDVALGSGEGTRLSMRFNHAF